MPVVPLDADAKPQGGPARSYSILDAHARPPEDVLAALDAVPAGLTAAEAELRRKVVGDNVLPSPPAISVWTVILHQFKSPLIYLLVAAAVVAGALGEWVDAAFIGVVLLLNAIIGAVQEFSAERSAAALAQMVPARSLVRRDSTEQRIEAAGLVPGDVVVVEAGDRVPADLRLIESHGVQADESMLTGESYVADKRHNAVVAAAAPLGDRETLLFAGTLLARGRAVGLVVATGLHTQLGAIAAGMQATRGGRSPLLTRMDSFSRTIAWIVAGVMALVAAIGVLRGMPTPDIFFACVALAVAAIPEGLPVALTVALSLATRRMAKQNVVARRLVAVEALGSCTWIASDKTGTLTQNRLTVDRWWTPGGNWEVTAAANPIEPNPWAALWETAVLCNDASAAASKTGHPGVMTWTGDAVDVALQEAVGRDAPEISARARQATVLDAIPFDADLRLAASLRRLPDGRVVVFVKGAPESVVGRCNRSVSGSSWDPATPLHEAVEQAAAGARILSFAQAEWDPAVPLSAASLVGLTFLGHVGMMDPLRPEALSAVAACRDAGITVAMVTGDHPATALAIARQLSLADSEAQVVTGAALATATQQGEAALDALVAGGRVFARVEPNQKLQIVQSLARAGHFVAVTGDGANDAPALRASHVGVAMGERGTDVAREASTLILTDDNFASIVAGISEGRVAYANVRKVTFLLIATGATEVVMFLLAMATGLPLPLLPVQLLWLNLVSNGIQDVALAFEPAEGDEMRRPPRKPAEAIFDRLMMQRVLVTATTMGVLSTGFFALLLQGDMSIDDARNVLLLAFVLFENVLVGAARSETNPVLRMNPLRNRVLLAGTATALLLHLLAMHVPLMQRVLSLSPAPGWTWAAGLGLALVPFVALEIHKRVRRT